MLHRNNSKRQGQRQGRGQNQRSNKKRLGRRSLRVERLSERRVLAAITGMVFEDINHSFARDASEPAAASRIVYVDVNDNAQLDVGEQLSIADSSGSFSLDGLTDGTYSIRLYNGTSTQIQTTPIDSDGLGSRTDIASGQHLLVDSSQIVVLTDTSIVVPDLSSQSSNSIAVADQVVQTQELPSGELLVIGNDASGETAWQVDPSDGTVTAVDLFGGPVTVPAPELASLAIDGSGFGLVLESSTGSGPIRAIDASNSATGIQVSVTSTIVPSDSMAITSDSGPRSIIASPSPSGLDLSLWSNPTASLISTTPITVAGVNELLAYDDDAGLLVLRKDGGGVSVHDVDANFAVLHEITDPIGPVAIDASRDLMFVVSPATSMLSLVGLSDGEEIADLAVDLSSIGTPAAVSADQANDSVVILGSLGIAEMTLDKPSAAQVVIAGDADVAGIEFGVLNIAANSAPRYETVPSFDTDEEVTLQQSAPALLAGSVDDESDHFLVIQTSETSNGTLTTTIAGAINYVPDLNFDETDSFTVTLHDGRDVSDSVTIEIVVNPVPDSPTGITINVDPVPEDLPLGDPIGIVEVIDGDGPGHVIVIDDDRFIEQGGMIIFNGGELDFETEPTIPLTITATDNETGEQVEETTAVTIRDRNDPITGILPEAAFVFENAPGDVITELMVLDQDEEQFHTFTVDDDRFIVEETDLRLVPGVSVDYEQEQTIIVNVTATEVGPGGTFTQAITINVRNLPEQPQALVLPNRTVTEFVPGDTVGEIQIDGATPEPRYAFSVDDDRFEFDGTTLKLIDELFVSRATETQIQIEVTATDTQGAFADIDETFVIEVLENLTPAHNRDNPYDVNHGGDVGATDALAVINYLNSFGPGPVGDGDLAFCYDVNADGFVTALDALLVVNRINQINNGGGGGSGEGGGDDGGEGEQIAPAAPLQQPQQLAPQQPAIQQPAIQQRFANDPFAGFDPADADSVGALETIDEAMLRDLAISSSGSGRSEVGPSDGSIEIFDLESETDQSEIDELDDTIGLLSNKTPQRNASAFS